jgi:hypothetical protein
VGDCCNCFGQSQLWRNGRKPLSSWSGRTEPMGRLGRMQPKGRSQ